MTFLRTQQLMRLVSQAYHDEKSKVSKAEIQAKINEIKYMAGLKNVSRLNIRKEMVHLEHQLQGLYDVEKKLLVKKMRENKKEKMLKEEIARLRHKLALNADKDMHQKIERVSYMLGDYLAKERAKKEVVESVKGLRHVKKKALQQQVKESIDTPGRIRLLQERIEALKEMLEVHQELETSDPEKVKMIEQSIMMLDAKLQALIGAVPQEVKHTMIFSMPEKKIDLSEEEVQTLERMLPLPPPPKMRI